MAIAHGEQNPWQQQQEEGWSKHELKGWWWISNPPISQFNCWGWTIYFQAVNDFAGRAQNAWG